MKLNWNSKIIGNNVILVPYCQKHVPKYHEWMKNEDLQHLTGSEPLTLEQEYVMQETWRDSDDKCTFIILHKKNYLKEDNEIKAMIGDTNIFLRTEDSKLYGEAEIMIADQNFRGQKLGWEAMHLMLLYGINHIKVQNYDVKIKMDNKASIKMFEKIGFKETSRSEIFEEITFGADISEEWIKYLINECGNLNLEKYNHN